MWLRDTNIVGAFTNRQADGHARVVARVATLGWSQIGLPIVVAAEILAGRLPSVREAHRRTPRHLVEAFARLQWSIEFLSRIQIVSLDQAAVTASRRGSFPSTMDRGDKPIAAMCLAGGHTLVTRNVAHFVNVPGLVIDNWIDEEL